jgi:DNA-binding transcriptional ArsR family regulator
MPKVVNRGAKISGSVVPASVITPSHSKRSDDAKDRLRGDQERLLRDSARSKIVTLLAQGEQHVGAICNRLGQSQPAVSHHLALLRHANIIAPRREGKHNFYSLTEVGVALLKVAETVQASPTTRRRIVRSRAALTTKTVAETARSAENQRRARLIFKKNRAQLSVVEVAELERLQSASRARMQRNYPAPTLIDEKLKRLEAKLRGSHTEKP